MKSIQNLKNIHGCLPVVVLGAGPSLPADFKKIPEKRVLIGVNHHFQEITTADYIVFMDRFRNTPGRDMLKKAVSKMENIVKISQHKQQSDYEIDISFWNGGFSATLATWLACYISAGPVLLCGMDCYQGKEKYFYDVKRPLTHPVFSSKLEVHLKAWSAAFENVQDPDRIKAVSGPLINVFGKYTPRNT